MPTLTGDKNVSSSDILRFDLSLGTGFSKFMGVAIPGLDIGNGLGAVDFGGAADLAASGSVALHLAAGIDMNNPGLVYLFEKTADGSAQNPWFDGAFHAGADDITFRAAVGPLGVFITGGSAHIDLDDISFGLNLNNTAFPTGRVLITDLNSQLAATANGQKIEFTVQGDKAKETLSQLRPPVRRQPLSGSPSGRRRQKLPATSPYRFRNGCSAGTDGKITLTEDAVFEISLNGSAMLKVTIAADYDTLSDHLVKTINDALNALEFNFNRDVAPNITGNADIYLPIYFPAESIKSGSLAVDASLNLDSQWKLRAVDNINSNPIPDISQVVDILHPINKFYQPAGPASKPATTDILFQDKDGDSSYLMCG